MKVKVRTPLDKIMGSLKEVPLHHPAMLADLLRMLMEEAPELKPYAGFRPGDVQPYGLLVWRGAKLLTLTDMVHPTDELEMIPMVAGG
ncbi:MAG: MoaD/ThiS family protein [Syntrophaceae bacterium]|nr:MoaD/ThiS family protein [Syntrophaceae bacterium]